VNNVADEVVRFHWADSKEHVESAIVLKQISSMSSAGSRFYNINRAVSKDVALFLGQEAETR